MGEIRSLHKNGNKENVSKYIPITLLSNLAKILQIYFVAFEEKYKPIQFSKLLVCRGCIKCVFLDLAKAFDTVNLDKLLKVVHDLGC